MTQCIENIFTLITAKLENRGFTALREFSAVDSLVHGNEMLAFVSLEDCTAAAQTVDNTDLSVCVETDYKLCIRLFGKSGDFVDYETFSTACTRLFYDIVSDGSLLICKMQMSKAVQSMPLKRLERDITLTVRATDRPEVQLSVSE